MLDAGNETSASLPESPSWACGGDVFL